jgi:hypothetical protein
MFCRAWNPLENGIADFLNRPTGILADWDKFTKGVYGLDSCDFYLIFFLAL